MPRSEPRAVRTYSDDYKLTAAYHEACHGILVGKDWYNAIRDLSPESLTDVERAARLLYLNRHCFNGLYRTNKAGGFNVPFAARKTGVLPTLEELRQAGSLL